MKLFILLLIFLSLWWIKLFFIKKENFNNDLKILHLVLYSDDLYYNQMYNLTSNYYKKFINVKTIYYTFCSDCTNTQLVNDILYIKGEETYLPGILDKTIKTFEYFKDYDCDYIIRSNISTIINFNLLIKKLDNKSIDYGGSIKLFISDSYRDPNSGINNNIYSNTSYISGTCIILSKKLFDQILLNKNYIDYNVIDDVSIGVLIQNYFPNIKLNEFSEDFLAIDQPINDSILKTYLSKIIFYRNRNKNNSRNIDVNNMNYIINSLNQLD
jgi:hypothetical protein